MPRCPNCGGDQVVIGAKCPYCSITVTMNEGKSQNGLLVCPKCEHHNYRDASKCEMCGCQLFILCDKCNHRVFIGAKCCSHCGSFLTVDSLSILNYQIERAESFFKNKEYPEAERCIDTIQAKDQNEKLLIISVRVKYAILVSLSYDPRFRDSYESKRCQLMDLINSLKEKHPESSFIAEAEQIKKAITGYKASKNYTSIIVIIFVIFFLIMLLTCVWSFHY